MSAKSRRKGKLGELEIRSLARELGFATAQRGAPMQAQGGEVLADVCEVGRLWIESKRYRKTPVNKFAREVLSGDRPGFVAVLAYRDDHQPETYAVVRLRDLLKLEAQRFPTMGGGGIDAALEESMHPCSCKRCGDCAGKTPTEPA